MQGRIQQGSYIEAISTDILITERFTAFQSLLTSFLAACFVSLGTFPTGSATLQVPSSWDLSTRIVTSFVPTLSGNKMRRGRLYLLPIITIGVTFLFIAIISVIGFIAALVLMTIAIIRRLVCWLAINTQNQ